MDFSYHCLRLFYAIGQKTPPRILNFLSDTIESIAYGIGIRKRVVEVNLSLVYGLSPDHPEVRKCARECYRFLARSLVRIISLKPESNLEKANIVFRGSENLKESSNSNSGTIILSGHIGNFILGAYALEKGGIHHHIVGKITKNPSFNRFVRELYGKFGYGAIFIRAAKNDALGARKILKTLRDGGIVIIQNDQDAGPDGHPVLFFGKEARIPRGPGKFAYKTGARVVTGFTYEEEDGTTIVEIQKPIPYSHAPTMEEAEKIILNEFNRRLEEVVRKYPEQYFWFHKKWKSNPEIRALYEGKQ